MATNKMSFMSSMNVKQTTKGLKVTIDMDKLMSDVEANKKDIYQGKKGKYLNLFIAPKAAGKVKPFSTHYVSVLPNEKAEETK